MATQTKPDYSDLPIYSDIVFDQAYAPHLNTPPASVEEIMAGLPPAKLLKNSTKLAQVRSQKDRIKTVRGPNGRFMKREDDKSGTSS